MAKWADYLVSAVRYTTSQNTKYISHLRLHVDNGDSVGHASVSDRENVVKLLENGVTFSTVYKKDPDNTDWNLGKKIEVYNLNRKKFVKTISNDKEEDNLEELPEF